MPYRLEKYNISPNKPIYHQAKHYYELCELEWNFTKQTMENKINSLNHFLRYSRLDRLENLTNEMVTDYIKSQAERGLKPRTINNRTKHILAIARYYMDYEDMEIPRFRDRKIKKQHEEQSDKRAFSRDIVYEALAYADREAWLLIKIGFDCGLRISELRMMHLKDLDGNRLLVHGKGRKKRFAILNDETLVRLKDWINQRHVTTYIFESNYSGHRGRPKSGQALRTIMRKPFTKCGIVNACPHELRHSYASDLLDLGASVRSIQQALGHSTERITETYLHELVPGKTMKQLYDLKYSASEPNLR